MESINKRKLIVVTGPMGSGKSTWVNKYLKTNSNVLVVSGDSIRFGLFGSSRNYSNEAKVFEIMKEQIHRYAEVSPNVTVIVEDTRLTATNYNRELIVFDADEFLFYELFVFNRTLRWILKNNKKRPVGERHPLTHIKESFNSFQEVNSSLFDFYNPITLMGNSNE